MLLIDITSTRDQTFKTTLDGETVRIRLYWSDIATSWYMDIDGISFDMSFKGIRIRPNQYLLDGYAVREIGQLMLLDQGGLSENPTKSGLGDRWILIYFTVEEMGYDTV